jgi:hypothetical protein
MVEFIQFGVGFINLLLEILTVSPFLRGDGGGTPSNKKQADKHPNTNSGSVHDSPRRN